MNDDRRDFLRKGAIAGAAMWSAPAVTTVAGAVAVGSPRPGLCSSCAPYPSGGPSNCGARSPGDIAVPRCQCLTDVHGDCVCAHRPLSSSGCAAYGPCEPGDPPRPGWACIEVIGDRCRYGWFPICYEPLPFPR